MIALAVGAVVPGCAVTSTPPPTPARMAELESRQAARPASAEARLQLAAAYHAANRHGEVANLLEPVVQAAPRDPAVWFLLASAHQAEGRLAEARAAWQSFLESGPPPALQRKARARLALLERRELEAAVRTAIAREQTLAAQPAQPRNIGVFPFLFRGNSEYQPLGAALAEMLTTDLAQTDRLTILERARIQFMMDELRLAESGLVDTTTAARLGRMLGAGRLVQGSIDEAAGQLRLDALVVALAGLRDTAQAPVRQQGPLDQLFELEKQLALALYAQLGVQLTVAERERVLLRHTDNVQALLAFGFGLDADRASRWAEAAGHFERALRFDGRFELARNWLEQAQLRAEASAEDDDELDRLAELELGWYLPDWLRRRHRFRAVDPIVPGPNTRNPIPELFGVDALDQRARVIVVVRPPRSE